MRNGTERYGTGVKPARHRYGTATEPEWRGAEQYGTERNGTVRYGAGMVEHIYGTVHCSQALPLGSVLFGTTERYGTGAEQCGTGMYPEHK